MKEQNLQITIEVYASEDLENGILTWEHESIALIKMNEPIMFTKTELDVLIDSINCGEMNPMSAECWHEIDLERNHVNNGISEPNYDWYALKHMRTIPKQ
jgi:hypothetical protein